MIVKIDTPPPTISGDLHIGHIFSYCHIDIMARYFRLVGKDVIFPIGFDCNGLPTEKLIKKDKEYSLEKYINKYKDLFKKMRFTMDYSKSYNTLEMEDYAINVYTTLYEMGLLYKAEKECYYDVEFNTPLSNTEVEEIDGKLISEISKKEVIIKKVNHIFLKLPDKDSLLEFIKPLKFRPEIMKNKLIKWIEDLNQDWCISRDRDYGIKIPANSDKVFDTWFVSALTPNLYTDSKHTIRFQSHEIIRSWCFYSIVMAYYLKKELPFTDVIISGWVTDQKGNKFSKSLGNFKDVNKLIDQYGVNQIRYWCANANLGNDTLFDDNTIKTGKRLETKIINAEKFFTMRNAEMINTETKSFKEFHNLMLDYNFAEAIKILYKEFFEFCSIDIEQCKVDESIVNKKYTEFLEYKKLFSIFLIDETTN